MSGRWMVGGSLGVVLAVALPAWAGDWGDEAIGTSIPLWVEYPGRCSLQGAGIVDGIEIHPDCGDLWGPVNDTVKVWVKVFQASGTATCGASYTLVWGNHLE